MVRRYQGTLVARERARAAPIRCDSVSSVSRGAAKHRVIAGLIACACAATLTALPDHAEATSCVQPQLARSKKHAAFVFTGRVVRELENRPTYMVDVQVERVFKGALPEKVELSAGGMTGATLQKGKRYLIFARREEPGAPLFAHLCGGTQPLSQATAWIEKLGPGSAPTAGAAEVAAPPIDPEPEETPPESTEPESLPEPEPTSAQQSPEPSPPPPAASAPPAAPPRGGCGACTLGTSSRDAVPAWGALLLAWMFRRRARRPILRGTGSSSTRRSRRRPS